MGVTRARPPRRIHPTAHLWLCRLIGREAHGITIDRLICRGMQLTRAGLRLLVFAAIGMGVHVWIGSSALLAHQVRGEGVLYLFVPSEPAWLMAWIPLALALLLSVHRWVGQPETDWAKPLLLLWLTPLPLLALVPGVGRFLSVVSFVLVDLRWWWTGIVSPHRWQRHPAPRRRARCRASRTFQTEVAGGTLADSRVRRVGCRRHTASSIHP